MANSQANVTWQGINLSVHFNYSRPEPGNNYPGGIDDMESAIVCDQDWEETPYNLLDGDRITARAVSEIVGLILKSASKSEGERALDSLMGRHEWEHFFSHGRRMVG